MLASVHIYPLKGCRAVDLDEAVVEPWGLAGDRRWLLVDADGQFVTQREHPALARLVVSYGPGADITVSCDGYLALSVAAPRGALSCSRSPCGGRRCWPPRPGPRPTPGSRPTWASRSGWSGWMTRPGGR